MPATSPPPSSGRSAAAAEHPAPGFRRAARGALAWVANRLDAPVVILGYHRVARLDHDPQQLAVSPERFAQQLERLRARFPILRFEQDWRGERRPAVVLTFDDGYADNLHAALPALERCDAPACFFVTTGPVEDVREFWWDALERCLLEPGERPSRFTAGRGATRESWPTATAQERRWLYDLLHPRLKRMLPEVRDAWLGEVYDWSGIPAAPRPSHRPLTQAEVCTLAASPLATVGAHSVTHPALTVLPPKRQRIELAAARATLERWTGRPVTSASFPFGGRHDFDRSSVQLTRETGYARNATTVPRCAHTWSDPLRLPRHLVRDWDGEEFERRLTAFLRT